MSNLSNRIADTENKKSSKRRRNSLFSGTLVTLFGCMLWGFSGTSVQYLTSNAGANAALVTVMRMSLGGVLFLICILIAKRKEFKTVFSSKEALLKVLLFSFSLYANQICYSQTVQSINAGTATVFETGGAAIVMLYICARKHQLPSLKELIGLVLAILAATMIATQGDARTLSLPLDGFIWALLTALTAAVYTVTPKELGLFESLGSFTLTGTAMLFGMIFAACGYFIEGHTVAEAQSILAGFNSYDWTLYVVGAVIAGTMGGYGFYLKGISMVGPIRGSLLSAAEPVSATLFAVVWLGTAFTLWDITGLVLMCVMIVFVSTDDKPKKPEES